MISQDSLLPPPVTDPVVLDLFAGPGGLDVAAQWLGIPAIGIELDDAAFETREAAGLTTIQADVTQWAPSDFSDEVNVLTGGPPCQTFTVAGNGHGRRALEEVIALVARIEEGEIDGVLDDVSRYSDVRTGLVLQPLIWAMQAIDLGRPFEAILLEQVPSVKPVWDAMATVLKANGYHAEVRILRTEEYGVPQTRRRAVLLARRRQNVPTLKFPLPTHQRYVGTAVDAAPVIDAASPLPRWVSMAEALGTTNPFTVVSNYGSGGDPRNRCQRRHDRPAFTVTGKVSRNRMVFDDGTETRFDSAAAGLLQTFPRDYPWRGRDIAQQIGNAIPPRLGAHLLSSLLGIAVPGSEFFRDKQAEWVAPDSTTASRIRRMIARKNFMPQPYLEVMGRIDRQPGTVRGQELADLFP